MAIVLFGQFYACLFLFYCNQPSKPPVNQLTEGNA